MKWLLLALGWLSVALGILGAFLPGLPTTPFLLLAAICFSKASPRWHHWLISHPKLGPIIKDWQDHGVIPLKAKVLATVLLIPTIIFSLFFARWPNWVSAVLLSIVASVMVFIWTRKSRP